MPEWILKLFMSILDVWQRNGQHHNAIALFHDIEWYLLWLIGTWNDGLIVWEECCHTSMASDAANIFGCVADKWWGIHGQCHNSIELFSSTEWCPLCANGTCNGDLTVWRPCHSKVASEALNVVSFLWQIDDLVFMVSITIALHCFLTLNDVNHVQLEHGILV